MATEQPPSTVQASNSQHPPIPPPSKSRKRSLDNSLQIQNSRYFKMRCVLKDLRPLIFEVLRAPDFKHCKAAEEIREKIKLMMELYQMIPLDSLKHDPSTKYCTYPNGNAAGMTKPSDTRSYRSCSTVGEKQQTENLHKLGSYVVGGSAIGWNYITFGGAESVYYGVTKKTFRESQANSRGE